MDLAVWRDHTQYFLDAGVVHFIGNPQLLKSHVIIHAGNPEHVVRRLSNKTEISDSS